MSDKHLEEPAHGGARHFSPKFFETEGKIGAFQKGMHWVTSFLEIILAVVLVFGVIFSFVQMPEKLLDVLSDGPGALMTLVNYIAVVIIAIELIHVIMSQNLNSVIEILMMAFTRELVIREWKMIDLVLGVLVIAGLFAIKKFLLSRDKK